MLMQESHIVHFVFWPKSIRGDRDNLSKEYFITVCYDFITILTI